MVPVIALADGSWCGMGLETTEIFRASGLSAKTRKTASRAGAFPCQMLRRGRYSHAGMDDEPSQSLSWPDATGIEHHGLGILFSTGLIANVVP
jgi:hypothetical protein